MAGNPPSDPPDSKGPAGRFLSMLGRRLGISPPVEGAVETVDEPSQQARPSLLHEILEDNAEDGFIDLSFVISQTEVMPDGMRFTVAGLHQGLPLGFGVEIRPLPGAGMPLPDLDIVVYPAAVALLATGEESHSFVRVLAGLFGAPRENSVTMIPRLELTGLSLQGAPSRIATEYVKIKLFHETTEILQDDQDDPRYFEPTIFTHG